MLKLKSTTTTSSTCSTTPSCLDEALAKADDNADLSSIALAKEDLSRRSFSEGGRRLRTLSNG